ncbi:MAG: putative PEP-binding protein [Candidatus Dormibacteraceae bacterium]
MAPEAPGVIRGTPASPGRASGPLHVVEDGPGPVTPLEAGPGEVRAAAQTAAASLQSLAGKQAAGGAGQAVLEAQAMMLVDPSLLVAIEEGLGAGLAAPEAVTRAAGRFARELEEAGDDYLRERATDMREAGRLLLAELGGTGASRLAGLSRPSVVVARELAPADTLSADRSMLLALVTEGGGRNSHVAIIARELGIPAVVGARDAVAAARPARAAEVDGGTGEVTLLDSLAGPPAKSGPRSGASPGAAFLPLMGNAGSVAAVELAAAQGARGVGLFRTEFLYLERSSAPSEEEQEEAYAAACSLMAPHPVIVRTLDTGSDKALPYLPAAPEPNPALGRRGVRLWLRHRELREPQARALVRAARRCPNLWVMAPMVAAREEMEAVRLTFMEQAERLACPPPPLGMMVEVPAVAIALDQFAGLVEFFSVGTNDLTQYAVGADRELDLDAWLAEFNPGVLRLIEAAIRSAHALEVKIGVCGEMAGTPEGATLLAGLGAGSLSMAAGCLRPVAERLISLGPERCRRAAAEALAARSTAEALAALRFQD